MIPVLLTKKQAQKVCPRSHSYPITDSGLPDAENNILSFHDTALLHVIPETDTPVYFLFCGIDAYCPSQIQKHKSTGIVPYKE